MVERLKQAIERARRERGAETTGRQEPAPARRLDWSALPEITPTPQSLRRKRVVAWDRAHPATTTFDILRSRIMLACKERNWTRIGVTSAGKGAGKSLVCANIALSAARMLDSAVMLIDLDLRAPKLASLFGAEQTRQLGGVLRGTAPLESCFARIGGNLALGLNTQSETASAELLHNPQTRQAIDSVLARLQPNLCLVDMPPALGIDDVIHTLPMLDAILLVVEGGQDKAENVLSVERVLEHNAPLLGVVLNKGEVDNREAYGKY